ncbi:twitch domain-containing radical SAM protein [Engelhardtia mirabilis]|uniref:Radical SAM superfamily protein n=1 Tax=Engelhardtia mirabilis TaxID=2528011 RepID=A0A518BHH0_9BACT|nr:Radical SAM superfamily protein [Planctomycetes bacterium Pla133]QDV00731.1 Radical SAM superfamily protein [Planctomycetes bacterium Pla86]
MTHTFCVYPWIHSHVGPSGLVSLCCFASAEPRPELVDERGRRPNLQDVAFGEVWNSDAMREIRRKLLAGERVRECSHCYHKEAVGGSSPRKQANGEWLVQHPRAAELRARIERAEARGHRVEEGLTYLDVRPGNACNLGCRMCGGMASSFLAKDAVHATWELHGGAPVDELRVVATRRDGGRFASGKPWHRHEAELIEELLGRPENLDKVYLAGGEPLFNGTVAAIVEHLVDCGAARHVDLSFSTNLTVWNEELIGSLEAFRSVVFLASIDAEGATYEYLRYPAGWDTVVDHVERLRALPFVHLELTPTVQNANALDLARLLRFAELIDVPYSLATLYEPTHLSVHAMPAAAREEAATRLEWFMARSRLAEHYEYLVDSAKVLLADMRQPSPAPYRELMRTFNLFTNDLDADRGQSLAASCPELWQYIREDPDYTWTDERVYAPRAQGAEPAA